MPHKGPRNGNTSNRVSSNGIIMQGIDLDHDHIPELFYASDIAQNVTNRTSDPDHIVVDQNGIPNEGYSILKYTLDKNGEVNSVTLADE